MRRQRAHQRKQDHTRLYGPDAPKVPYQFQAFPTDEPIVGQRCDGAAGVPVTGANGVGTSDDVLIEIVDRNSQDPAYAYQPRSAEPVEADLVSLDLLRPQA